MKLINIFTNHIDVQRKTLLLILLCLSLDVFAYDIFSDGIYYNTLSSNTVEVTYTTENDEYRYVGDVEIPDKITENNQTYYVTSIGNRAFYGCTKLKSVIIGNNVTSIGDEAFRECKSLVSLYVGRSVRKIGDNAFIGSPLQTIEVDEDNYIYDSRDNCNAIIETDKNALLLGCKTTKIPASVVRIEDKAFKWCDGMESVVLPENLEVIGSYAFSECENLKKIVSLNQTPPKISENSFPEDVYRNAKLQVPAGCVKAYQEDDVWRKFTYIADEHYYKCDVNEDGNVDISDIVAVINAIATGSTDSKNDVNGDDAIDISDIVAIINAIASGNEKPKDDDKPNEDQGIQFKANQFWCGYYGNYIGTGTGMYIVEINNGTIDDAGYLTSPGYAITLAVNGKMPKAGETLTLPVGTYKTNLEITDNFKIINEDVGSYLSFVEMKYEVNEESKTEYINGGTMTVINNGNGTYTITCELELYYIDSKGNKVEDGTIKGTYMGQISVDNYTEDNDNSSYDVLKGDVDLGEMTVCAGSYYLFTRSELSNYYLSLFGTDYDWDKGEFLKPGYMLAIDLFTEYSEKLDFNQLNADFSIAELNKFEEWTFQPGMVTESQGQPAWTGTYVDEISEQTDPKTGEKYYGYGKSAMITSGTIKATSDGETVTFVLDLVTEAGGKVTGTYTGKPDVEVPENNEINYVHARKMRPINTPVHRNASKHKSQRMVPPSRKNAQHRLDGLR